MVLLAGLGLYAWRLSHEPVQKWDAEFASYGHTRDITLPDNTKIWLHNDSRVVFPDHFKGKERTVYADEGVSPEESACIRCGRCVRACPMGLMPTQMDAAVRHNDVELAEKLGVMNCMECGSCTYSCPAKRELTQSFRMAKAALRARKAK